MGRAYSLVPYIDLFIKIQALDDIRIECIRD